MAVFEFSESVTQYFDEPRLKVAVDELTKGKHMLSGFDPAFDWGEFPKFVDAWVSAQKVVGDWAKDLFRLWDATWGAELSSVVRYASRELALEELANGGISEAWNYGWYARAVRSGNTCVNLVVFYEVREGKKGFHLQVETPEEFKKLNIPGWETTDDLDLDGPFHPILVGEGIVTVDLVSLREDARRALEQLGVSSG